MRRFPAPLFSLLATVLIAFFFIAPAVAEAPADAVLINARIYTVNSKQPWAEALAIRDGSIVAVGSAGQIAPYRGPKTRVIDAEGHLVLPGFEDCHIHFMEGSLGLSHVDLNDTESVAEIQKRVKDFAASHPKDAWITGMGWQYPVFGSVALPNKKILDDIVPDRPVFLTAYDGHTTWANSKALQMAGITRDTPDPPNGKIVHDEAGEPTGALKEAASHIVYRLLPEPTRDERLQALRQGIHEANKVGLVRVHSAGGDFEYLDLYDQLRRDGQLTLRFYIAYFLNPPELTRESIDKIEQAARTYHDAWISGGAVKTMVDGVIESHTAAMLAPYTDDPTQQGKLFWDPDKHKQAVIDLDRRGMQIFTHAIGDKGIRTALDSYEAARQANHTVDARPRVEHIETIDPQDIPRFGKLGVIASMQPLHSYPNQDTLEVWARNIGPERASHAWVWNSIAKAGGHFAFGSDWPVVTLNPWYGVQTALTRQTREGIPPGGFVPSQRISLEDTIRGYTLGAAYAARRDTTEGSLEPGKVADFIVLDQDLFKTPPAEIYKTTVRMTVVGGQVVYQEAAK